MLTNPSQMLKSGLSGVAATAADFVVLCGLVELVGLPVGVAAFIAAALGACVGFTATKVWAFADPRPVDPRQVAAFALVAVGNAMITAALIQMLASGAGIVYPVAKILASSITFLLWSYPAQSRWVFGKGERYAT